MGMCNVFYYENELIQKCLTSKDIHAHLNRGTELYGIIMCPEHC